MTNLGCIVIDALGGVRFSTTQTLTARSVEFVVWLRTQAAKVSIEIYPPRVYKKSDTPTADCNGFYPAMIVTPL